MEGVPAVVAAAQSVAAGLKAGVDAALQVGQAGASGQYVDWADDGWAQIDWLANTAGLAGAEAGLAVADVLTFAGDIASGTGLGGAGGLGAGMSAELGKARLVGQNGASDLGGVGLCADGPFGDGGFGGAPAEVPAAGGPMGMMPDADGYGGAGVGRRLMMGRGGKPHVVQAGPVVPRADRIARRARRRGSHRGGDVAGGLGAVIVGEMKRHRSVALARVKSLGRGPVRWLCGKPLRP